ncbi:MAG TPA: biopolymer transporter ExbD [Candidatus Eisenbacteria bacterium]|nr:biopolymer transporter ExbD [Candidatus Eisenbacteria bacterium]
MAGRRWRMRNPESIFEPNMTPLIDVCLVLVVILMVATPMAFQSSIGVQKAAKAGKAAAIAVKSERVEISIVSADTVTVNRTTVVRKDLPLLLKPLLQLSNTKTVIVHCADTVPHGAFVGVLDEAKQCGAAQIAVVGG